MSERETIIDICMRLSWHVDRQEWEALAELLADPVTVDYTSVNGGSPETYTPRELVEGMSALLGQLDATQHVQANHLVTVNGNTAVCTANVLGFHKLANPLGSAMRTIGGYYRFELEEGTGGWKIRHWQFNLSWADGNHGIMAIVEENRTTASPRA